MFNCNEHFSAYRFLFLNFTAVLEHLRISLPLAHDFSSSRVFFGHRLFMLYPRTRLVCETFWLRLIHYVCYFEWETGWFFAFQRVEHGRKCRTSVGRARQAYIPFDKLIDESLLLIDPPVVETFIRGVVVFSYCELSFCSFLKRQLNPARI